LVAVGEALSAVTGGTVAEQAKPTLPPLGAMTGLALFEGELGDQFANATEALNAR
jgi:hypothetical protein